MLATSSTAHSVPVLTMSSTTQCTGALLRGVIANFVGGLIIIVYRPFHVGDWIRTDRHEAGGVLRTSTRPTLNLILLIHASV